MKQNIKSKAKRYRVSYINDIKNTSQYIVASGLKGAADIFINENGYMFNQYQDFEDKGYMAYLTLYFSKHTILYSGGVTTSAWIDRSDCDSFTFEIREV